MAKKIKSGQATPIFENRTGKRKKQDKKTSFSLDQLVTLSHMVINYVGRIFD
jgi:hypothetical protein